MNALETMIQFLTILFCFYHIGPEWCKPYLVTPLLDAITVAFTVVVLFVWIIFHYPEVITTAWVGFCALYTKRYDVGCIMSINFIFQINFIKLLFYCEFLKILYLLSFYLGFVFYICRYSREMQQLECEIIDEIHRNNPPYKSFWEYVWYITSGQNTSDRRICIAVETWIDRVSLEKQLMFNLKKTNHFRTGWRHIEMECSICLCGFEFHDELTKSFRCNHVFHRGCCEEWLRRSVAGTCPLCRSSRLED